MSKKKSGKKNPVVSKKKKSDLKAYITIISVLVGIAVIIAGCYFVHYFTSLESTDFANTVWRSQKAYDASSDEVDMATVYSNKYDNYQGSLELKGDGTFTFWMSPGDPTDGTHNGKYTYNRDKNALSVEFDNGEKANLKIIRDENNVINHIEVPYKGYNVWFYNN